MKYILRKLNKNLILLVLLIVFITIILPLSINLVFFKPTKINAFIAANIYNAPANTAFTDDNFYQCIVDKYNSTNGTSVAYTESITDDQLKTITSLYCYGKSINNVNGIEKLTNLKVLELKNNQLTTIDISNNIALTSLSLNDNNLTEIDVNKNTALEDLNISNNKLTEIDISKNTSLKALNLDANQLIKIDVSKNTALTSLSLSHNQLTELDLNKNTNLKLLYIMGGNLTKLDLSNNTALTTLWLNNNKITEININKNINLTNLYLYENELTEIDVSKNTALIYLYLYGNQLTEIDVSQNTALIELSLFSNKLTKIDVTKNTALKSLALNDNQLKMIDVSKNNLLTYLGLHKNELKEINVSNNTNLTTLNLDYNQLTDIDISKNTSLTTLSLNNNQLKGIDVSNNTRLSKLNLIEAFKGTTDIVIYKGVEYQITQETINTGINLLKLPTSFESTFHRLKSNDLNIINNIIQPSILGSYQLEIAYENSYSALSSNRYSVLYNVQVIEVTSTSYIINDNESWIFVGFDNDQDTIKNNISVPEGIDLDVNLETNKIKVLNGNDVLKEFDILRINTNEYELKVDETDKIINKLKEKTTVSDILSNIDTIGTVTVKNNKDKVITDKDIIDTGSKLIIELENKTIEYTLVVSGDVTGDGIVNIADVVKIADHTMIGNLLNIYEKKAAEVTGNSTINIADIVKIADYTLNKSIEIWR